MSAPRVTVIVCTRNRPDRLRGCLVSRTGLCARETSCWSSTRRPPPSNPPRRRACGARVIRCEQPGLSRARNAGWRAARQHRRVHRRRLPAPALLAPRARAPLQPGSRLGHGQCRRPPEDLGKDRPVAVVPPYDAGPITRDTRSRSAPATTSPSASRSFARSDPFHERLGAGTWLAGRRTSRCSTGCSRARARGARTGRGRRAPAMALAHASCCGSTGATARVRVPGSRCCAAATGTGAPPHPRAAVGRRGARRARDVRGGYEFGALSTTAHPRDVGRPRRRPALAETHRPHPPHDPARKAGPLNQSNSGA